MEIKVQIVIICVILIFLLSILLLLKKKRLELKYTLLWLLTGIILLILAFCPSILNWIVRSIGIYDVTNGLFAIAIFFILAILLSLTSIVSRLKNTNKTLAQDCALLEKRIRDIEESNKSRKI